MNSHSPSLGFLGKSSINRDRHHRVIESGPYRIVRHPGYIATILGLVLATSLLLGSWWAFIPHDLAILILG
ncbi:MAG: isoprenylcysteine carboxylmethyltransferase family protein [Xenococcaceae cyanobacterium MO_188.B32]|nr:isoprenylcysteine carboxylmethyltransferase family protein [Xenococcaceae cyanobacterium MO_188.B32]